MKRLGFGEAPQRLPPHLGSFHPKQQLFAGSLSSPSGSMSPSFLWPKLVYWAFRTSFIKATSRQHVYCQKHTLVNFIVLIYVYVLQCWHTLWLNVCTLALNTDQPGIVVERMGFEADQLELESWLCCLIAMDVMQIAYPFRTLVSSSVQWEF